MKLAFVSDTHELESGIAIPPCDVLVHTGDFTNDGEPERIDRFAHWIARVLAEQPVRHVVLIAGNHDLCLDRRRRESLDGTRARAIRALEGAGAIYLEDEEIVLEGLRIWGSPWTPRFYDWAFQIDDDEHDQAIWSGIPAGIDLLLSHGPPYGILDRTYDGRSAGSPALMAAVARVRPKLHAFGHIHESYGLHLKDGVLFVNGSTCNARYEPVHPPIAIELG